VLPEGRKLATVVPAHQAECCLVHIRLIGLRERTFATTRKSREIRAPSTGNENA
jgi:hypothetical protein